MSAMALPIGSGDETAEVVNDNWVILKSVNSRVELEIYMKANPALQAALGPLKLDNVWEIIDARENVTTPTDAVDLLKPEWNLFTNPSVAPQSNEFRIRDEGVPEAYRGVLGRIVSVERLRQVIALIGFSRIEGPDSGVASDVESVPASPLDAKNQPTWVPASEVRGEGIFIQIDEDTLTEWEAVAENSARERILRSAHEGWRVRRGITPANADWPGARYLLVHSLSHAIINQVALESGYATASIRERIYVRASDDPSQTMARVLLYTAAPDAEGTLGGLVRLPKTAAFDQILTNAIERTRLCSADPFCAEHEANAEEGVLHGAACHACLFVSETGCERGNRYLDRAVLTATMSAPDLLPFFAAA